MRKLIIFNCDHSINLTCGLSYRNNKENFQDLCKQYYLFNFCSMKDTVVNRTWQSINLDWESCKSDMPTYKFGLESYKSDMAINKFGLGEL